MEIKEIIQSIETTVKYSNKCYGPNDIDETVKKKLSVDNQLYKHRLYYKTVWETNMPILTFIMFNPSTANQYSTDPTINNCIKLAKKGIENTKFGGIEIYNLITIRHPNVIKTIELYKNEKKHINPLFNETLECKHICLAWGEKIGKGNTDIEIRKLENYNKIKNDLIGKILKKLKNHSNLYVYGNKKNKKPRHPSRTAFNTTKEQQLIKIDYNDLKKLYPNSDN